MTKAGRGFARLVTRQTLDRFSRVLIPAGVPQDRDRKRRTKDTNPADQEINELFGGETIKAPHPFKRPRRARAVKGGRASQSRRGSAPNRRSVRRRSQELLLTEIPKGSTRWKQANFKKVDFEKFFRADPSSRLTLNHVREDGTEESPEGHPKVSVKSHNFRIELGAAAGLKYPLTARPIGAFISTGPASFHYMLLMPNSSHYPQASAILAQHSSEPTHQMKRARVPITTARKAWPSSPLWRFAKR